MSTEEANFEKEAKRLRAEMSILRSNLTKVSKENDNLKMEKSKLVLGRIELEHEIKKKLEIKEKESRIEENQRNASKQFKSNTTDSVYSISPRFILENTLNLSDLQKDSLLKNLRFFKDFFFDDFFTISERKAIEIVNFFYSQSQRDFLDAFDLFCCKKTVFNKYSTQIYENNSFLKIKLNCLLEVPPDWIIEIYDSHLKKFIFNNRAILIELFANIAEKCPFYLSKILDKVTFTSFLEDINPQMYKLLYFIVKHNIKNFIDENNLHMIPKEFVIQLYSLTENEYIEL